MNLLRDRFARWDPAWRYAVALFLVLRIGLSAWGALVLAFIPAPPGPDDVLRPYQGIEPITGGWAELLLGAWQRFDTMWYLKIAAHGFSSEDGSLVYFPLYPFLIRVLAGNYLIAAIVISNMSFIGALYLLYKLVEQQEGEAPARRTSLYLALFPTAFFFLAGYSESLFLLLTLSTFYFARQERWVLAGLAGFLASLTRLQGILLILPLAYLIWRRGVTISRISASLFIPVGTFLYLAYAYSVGQGVLAAVYETRLHAQFVLPPENILGAIATLLSPQGTFIDFLNLTVTFLFLAMTVVVIFRLPPEYGIYMALTLVALLLRRTTTQPLVSMSRYVLTLFPAFILWGRWGENRWIHRLILYPSLVLLAYLAGQFFLWGWVA